MAKEFSCDPAAVRAMAESLKQLVKEDPARSAGGIDVPAIDTALEGFGQTAWQAESAARASTRRAASMLGELADGTLDIDEQLAGQVGSG